MPGSIDPRAIGPGLGLLLAVLGCSSGDGTEVPPGCELGRFTPCNVAKTGCQEGIFTAMACLRRQEQEALPEIRTITRAELRDELGASRPRLDPHITRTFELLGLIAPGVFEDDTWTERQVSFVVGTYDPNEKDITIVVDATTRSGASNVLAHEFVHALQDRDPGLGAFQQRFVDSTDSLLATDALVEGEAQLYQILWVLASQGLSSTGVDWDRFLENETREAEERVATSDSPRLETELTFPYTHGLALSHRAWDAGGALGLRSRYDAPPTQTREVLFGEAVETPENPFLPPVVDGFELVAEDSFGVWLAIAAAGRNAGSDFGQRMVEGWRDDTLWVFGSGDETAVIWQLRWEGLDLAGEVAGQLGGAQVNEESDGLASTYLVAATSAETATAAGDAVTRSTEPSDGGTAARIARSPGVRSPLLGRLPIRLRRAVGKPWY